MVEVPRHGLGEHVVLGHQLELVLHGFDGRYDILQGSEQAVLDVVVNPLETPVNLQLMPVALFLGHIAEYQNLNKLMVPIPLRDLNGVELFFRAHNLR